jgi:two-component system, response regulator PdtaR
VLDIFNSLIRELQHDAMSQKTPKGTVVIVEDDMLLSLVETRMIEKLGYQVVGTAVSGEDAIEQVEQKNPDIVVMDISLKGKLDGIETMEEIREFSDVPVIYLSGNSDQNSIIRASKTGYIDFLVKPVTPDELTEPLREACKQNQESLNEAS